MCSCGKLNSQKKILRKTEFTKKKSWGKLNFASKDVLGENVICQKNCSNEKLNLQKKMFMRKIEFCNQKNYSWGKFKLY